TVKHHENAAVQLAGLGQGEDLEQFIEGAEAPGKNDYGPGHMREPELAHEEIVEFEIELGGYVRIGGLFMRQPDIQADGASSRVGRAAIGRLHQAGTPARAYD